MRILIAAALLATALSATPASAAERTFIVNNPDVGVPVFPNDITDRPYKVLGSVKAGVRKATLFSGEASQEKIYKELWERADKLGADAVVKATYGKSHVTAMSWGSTTAEGVAIKFDAAPAAPAAAAQPAQ
jgi:uncharacterized protein YbjQ (UPF0145 family)